MIEQRAHDVLARLKKRPLGKLERDAAEVIEALLADRAEYVEVGRIQLRNSLSKP